MDPDGQVPFMVELNVLAVEDEQAVLLGQGVVGLSEPVETDHLDWLREGPEEVGQSDVEDLAAEIKPTEVHLGCSHFWNVVLGICALLVLAVFPVRAGIELTAVGGGQ